jgi:DNA repair protein RadD
MELRWYQTEALDSLFNYLKSGEGKYPLVVLPTASGKSFVIADFCRRVCSSNDRLKILILAHVRELLVQNQRELLSIWPDASTGVFSAGLDKKQTHAQITFAGIQSVHKHAYDFGKVDLVIVDEAHLIPRASQTRYQEFLSDIKKANPNVCIWGTTATPYRLDSGLICDGKDAIFDGVAYSADMKKLIKDGFLVPVVSKGGVKKIDLHNVHTQMGEYNAKELAYAADDPELIRLAVEEIVEYGKERKAWLVFASGVEHAQHVVKEIQKYGVTCELVTGETDTDTRDKIVANFKSGKTKCLVNVSVFTTGFNVPECDMIALLMATQSTGKYVQIVGRGMRTAPGKQDCLLLDYGQNVLTHGPIDEVNPIDYHQKGEKGDAERPAPFKECPKCHAIIHARAIMCSVCGYEYPVEAKHGTEAYSGAVLSDQEKSQMVDVVEFDVGRHKKPGAPDSIKVTMRDEKGIEYPIWLCLDHKGFAQAKARQMVKLFGGTPTLSVNEALKESYGWKEPMRIQVKRAGKFWDVMGIQFKPEKAKQLDMDGFENATRNGCHNCRWGEIEERETLTDTLMRHRCTLGLKEGTCGNWQIGSHGIMLEKPIEGSSEGCYNCGKAIKVKIAEGQFGYRCSDMDEDKDAMAKCGTFHLHYEKGEPRMAA